MKSSTALGLRLGLFFFVVLVAAGALGLWWHDALSPVDAYATIPKTFIINPGEGVRVIASRLAQQGLVRSPTGFFLLVKLMGIDGKLQAGDYRISPSMDTASIARELTHGILDVWITTLEGWRDTEIATELARDMDIPESEFLKYAAEGYMFPDTYLVPRNATAAAIVQMFTDNFNKKVTPRMHQDAQKLGMPFPDVITLASIVEREGRTEADRPVIAGILMRRLKADWPLQADATLQYALGYQPEEKTWWKKSLTDEDKKIDSPYNTYLHTGLPPGPIANPGLSSIQAVIYYQPSDYWYYLHDASGAVHYAKTIEEHNANIAKYLQ
ncbi:endolytic transglycosylase MltG [Patescibacteria group bacterium]|nr:endolytic transglycosylase MltG [Patescibacteria group bacterium]